MQLYEEFLMATSFVYDTEKEAIQKAKTDPQILNYLVGKIIQKTQGRVKPELALTVCKLMVSE